MGLLVILMLKSLPLSAVLLLSAGLCIFLGFVGTLRRGIPGARSFSLIMIASAIYAGAEAFELSGGDLGHILLAVKFEYIGISVLAPLWLLFTLEFCDRRLPPKPIVILIFAESAFTVAMIWTTELHGLFYSHAWIRNDGPFPLIGLEHGIAYWIHTVAMWVETVAGFFVLAIYAYRAPAPVRDSALLPVAGTLINLVSNIMLLLGATPYGIDIGPFGMTIAGVVFAVAINGRHFLILLPVARELILESIDDGLVILDSSGTVVDFNRSAATLLGLEESSAGDKKERCGVDRVGHSGRDLLAAALRRPELEPILASGEGCSNFDIPSEELFKSRRIRARTFPVKDQRERSIGVCILLTDVTETALLIDKLAELASTDGLTGALNRRRFREMCERDFELAKRSVKYFGILMLDLDFFKLVNDGWGHAAGDEVLKEICRRCKSELRCSDALGRLGGDEFAILLPFSDLEGTLAAAERLRAAIDESPVAWEGNRITVTISVGACNGVPAEGEDFSLFLRHADDALYSAKAAGRNRVALWSEVLDSNISTFSD